MHIIVVGAGVIGMTSAYYLAQDGHSVTVLDAHQGPGEGASFANGGQLSYSFSDALGSPEFLRALPRLLAGRDAGGRAALSPGLLAWGFELMRYSGRRTSNAKTLATYRAALRSRDLLEALRKNTGIEFSHRRSGKLICIAGQQSIRRAEQAISLKAPFGCDNVILSGREAIDVEPALADFRKLPEACIYSPGDEVGDAREYVTALADWLQANLAVTFRFNTTVDALHSTSRRVTAAKIADGEIDCDALVIAGGVDSTALLKPLGVRLPIRAMRGYSLSLPALDSSPSVSITALAEHFVFSRLGQTMRIAGFADFVHNVDAHFIRGRCDGLLRTARHVAPRAADFSAADKHRWSGLRPMMPDSQPMIAQTSVPGLYVNSGHGMLGWTLACASGETLRNEVRKGLA